MTNAATWMPEKRTQTPSPSPDLIPAKTINRKLTLKLAHQMGALHRLAAGTVRVNLASSPSVSCDRHRPPSPRKCRTLPTMPLTMPLMGE